MIGERLNSNQPFALVYINDIVSKKGEDFSPPLITIWIFKV